MNWNKIIECVPNFSEGRDLKKIDKIVKNLVDNPVIVLEDIKKLYDEIKILIDKARV